METRVELESIELRVDGNVNFKLRKEIWNGNVLAFSEPHRSSIDALIEPDEQIATVDAHLQSMGFSAMPQETAALIKEFRGAMHAKPSVRANIEAIRTKREKDGLSSR